MEIIFIVQGIIYEDEYLEYYYDLKAFKNKQDAFKFIIDIREHPLDYTLTQYDEFIIKELELA